VLNEKRVAVVAVPTTLTGWGLAAEILGFLPFSRGTVLQDVRTREARNRGGRIRIGLPGIDMFPALPPILVVEMYISSGNDFCFPVLTQNEIAGYLDLFERFPFVDAGSFRRNFFITHASIYL
jgi:hypothetical protein